MAITEIGACVRITITHYTPKNANKENGQPTSYTLHRSFYTIKRYQDGSEEVITGGTNSYSASVGNTCPSPFKTQSSGPLEDRTINCIYQEKESCSVAGNPINVGTAEKIEHEIDYVSADGLLKLERRYLNQNAGWRIEEPDHLVDVPVGSTAPMPRLINNSSILSDYVITNRWRRYSHKNPDAPYEIEFYNHTGRLSFSNLSAQNDAYVTQGSRRYKFVEQQTGIYTEASTKPSQRSLVRLHSGAATWKLMNQNGTASYFLPDGTLQRIEYADGKSLTYAYDEGRLVSKTDHMGRSLTYIHDDDNRLIEVVLPDGESILYTYGDDQESVEFYLLKQVTWPNGESIQYLYNEAEYKSGTNPPLALTGKLDSNGVRIGTYTYSGSNAVKTEGVLGTDQREFSHSVYYSIVTNGKGARQQYSFSNLSDGTRLLTNVTQPAGSGCAASSSPRTYTADGLLTKKTEFNGNITLYGYDAITKLEDRRVEGLKGSVSNTLLDPNATLPVGARKISTRWHSEQRKAVKVAEPKLLTTYIYNGDADPFDDQQIANCAPNDIFVLCRKVQQASTDGNGASGFNASLDNTLAPREWLYTYNAFGQLLTLRRSPTAVPEYTIEYYDTTTTQWTTGDRKSVTNALGQVTHFDRYDPNGRLLQMTDTNGVETHFTYDVRGRLTSQSIGGALTTHTYDLNGNRIGSELPNGVTITYHYDAAKRLIAIENALGDKIHYEYDVENNLRFERISNVSDTLTYMKEHVYDALSRLQNTIDSQGHTTTYLYDASGNLTGEQDAKQQQTSHLFDKLNQQKSTTDPLSGKTEYTYDGRGYMTQVKDPEGLITTYSYNPFGDLTQLTSPDTGTTTFTYDSAGNRTSATDSRNVVVSYTYDALNRLTGIDYPASPTENITYTYDETTNGNHGIGHLTGVSNAAGTTQYTYNPQGLITAKQVTLNNQTSTTAYTYDAVGQLTGITYPSGRIVTYTRDTAGRISGMTTRASSGATEYTLLSNLQYLPFGPANAYTYGNGLTLNHDYDQDYRLQGIEVSGINPVLERDYSYDPVNNITAIANPLHTVKNQSFGYDALNRLTSAQGVYGLLDYTYDAVGNRLTQSHDDGTAVHHDTYSYATDSHRLLGISRLTDNQPAGNRSFTYDNTGNRLTNTAEDGSTHTHTYNHANRMESVSVDSTATATYTYNPLGQRISKTTNNTTELYHYDEAGQLISVTDANGNPQREYIYFNNQPVAFITNNTIYYIHTDHLNTPQIVTDQNQQVVWVGDYQPFGKLTDSTSQTNNIELYSRFPGQYLDVETGLYYNYFRDYDPSIGRYIQSDPIGLEGGINTYAYVEGNPLIYTDPFGLARQYFIGGSATGALLIPGAGGGINFGISVPEDIKNWRCYQLVAGMQANIMMGGGIYAGAGLTASNAVSDGPVPVFSGGTYRYNEISAGYGISTGFSRTGSEKWSGGGIFDFINWVWGDGREADKVSSVGMGIVPKLGAGYGLYLGLGYTMSGSLATPTIGSDCECQ
ncbi:RHS repeat-associated core domain-containing protein [Cellvibrio sp. PSBB006]|uniref:RHS repeat-associated core domain-containing protein n=1 Tax=Cellvibrio sp. PSBB006 TaxID=1987723 RepID=UPI0018DF2C5A|nr:RHS repeat-associated core domain-containing protein [Cellvibrio sp. PSBB006]